MIKNKFAISFIGISLLIISIALFLYKQQIPAQEESEKMRVTTSFYPIYFFAMQIGGDKADVSNITPAGAEPHDYELTPQDVVRIENSDLLILNGGNLEAWSAAIQRNLDKNRTKVVVAGEGLTFNQIEEEGEIITDPHVWLSPVLAQKMTDKIAEGLALVDASNKEYFLARAELLKAKLRDLDDSYKKGLNFCSKKDIITSHAAFGYLASAYGLTQIAITGLSPDAEPSPQQLADIVKFAKTREIKYIFFESLVSPKLSETIAREVGAQTLVLNPMEGLSNEESDQGKDYFSEMRNNLINLQLALQCRK